MQITKAHALELFTALELKTAAKWPRKRMEMKLGSLDVWVGKGKLHDRETLTLSDTISDRLDSILEAGKQGDSIEVVEVVTAEPSPDSTIQITHSAPEDSAPEDSAPDQKPQNVRYSRTRPYIAGQVICRYGISVGVTDAMVDELDSIYGKKNPTESKFCLRNSWHAIRGFYNLRSSKNGNSKL